jgi:CheY-like chemotaxis protein
MKKGMGVSGTILVVEDAAAVRAFTVRSLRRNGYTVLEASDGQEALGVAREFPDEIHLIVTDVVMPGMSGEELVSIIRMARPSIKALYVSGYPGGFLAQHGVLDSGIIFLQKPFTTEDLASKVRELIALKA